MALSRLFDNLCQNNLLYEAWTIVKAKNSAGGIDGMSITDFDDNSHKYISEILKELKEGKWKPQPYMGITIPKKKNERRNIGLLSIKDKIIQTAIKILIEPRFERTFLNCSYGYRPLKGHNKAIKRTQFECQNKLRNWVVKLDIDNFFDTVDHNILTPRLHAIIKDEEIVRLIMLSVKMGRVNVKNMKWQDINSGVPQGAVLSPILANYYLHPFDQFVLTLPCKYVRYADDFVLICDTKEDADLVLQKTSSFLTERLNLSLNPPLITELKDGFDFLGVNISKQGLSLSEAKRNDIKNKIRQFGFTADAFTPFSIKAWKGFKVYYSNLLAQELLVEIDTFLKEHIHNLIIKNHKKFTNRAVLNRILCGIQFLSDEFKNNSKVIVKELLELYDSQKNNEKATVTATQNKKIIATRKKEYQKREGENRELVVSTFGSFIGLTQKGITVKQQGKVIFQKPIGALSHITIQGQGISLSSNLIEHCLSNKISIDFFNTSGTHTGSILSNRYIENTFWNKQANCGTEKRHRLAQTIIMAKLKNQLNLVKYFHKYHKNTNPKLSEQFNQFNEVFNLFISFTKANNKTTDDSFITALVAHEAQGAVKYWGYIRELLSDDQIQFEQREHKGAKDIVNCMLNYGYAILYSRVWQALLKAKLNPFDSIIHVRQAGKPTFVYDVVEIFRAQAVDRIIISLVQKGLSLNVKDGLLDDDTKKLLAKGILDRLNRYENYRGEEITMDQIIKKQAKEIATYITEENKVYKPYVAKW